MTAPRGDLDEKKSGPIIEGIGFNELWRLFIDGVKQKKDNGFEGFERREPGYLVAVFSAFSEALSTISQELSIDSICHLQKLSISAVKNTNYGYTKEPGKLRDASITMSYDIDKSYASEAGIKDILDKMTSKKHPYLNFVDPKDSTKDVNQKLFDSLSEEESNTLKKELLLHFEHGHLKLKTRLESNEALKSHLTEFLNTYKNSITEAKDDSNKKLRAIIRFVKDCEHLHPFEDGNGRLFYMVIFYSELIKHGFKLPLMQDVNFLCGHSVDECVEDYRIGIENAEKLRKNPDAGLFDITSNKVLDDANNLEYFMSCVFKCLKFIPLEEHEKIYDSIELSINKSYVRKQKMIGVLIENKIDDYASLKINKQTPLHLAVSKKNENWVKLLLEAKADPNNIIDNEKQGLLQQSLQSSSIIAAHLINAHADINKNGLIPTTKDSSELLMLLTGLIVYTNKNDVMVKKILSKLFSEAMWVICTDSIIDQAYNHTMPKRILDLATEKNIEVNFNIKPFELTGIDLTPLQLAAKNNSLEMVSLLIERRASPFPDAKPYAKKDSLIYDYLKNYEAIHAWHIDESPSISEKPAIKIEDVSLHELWYLFFTNARIPKNFEAMLSTFSKALQHTDKQWDIDFLHHLQGIASNKKIDVDAKEDASRLKEIFTTYKHALSEAKSDKDRLKSIIQFVKDCAQSVLLDSDNNLIFCKIVFYIELLKNGLTLPLSENLDYFLANNSVDECIEEYEQGVRNSKMLKSTPGYLPFGKKINEASLNEAINFFLQYHTHLPPMREEDALQALKCVIKSKDAKPEIALKILKDSKVDINMTFDDKMTLLQSAALFGNISMVEALLKAKANPNEVVNNELSVLQEVVINKRSEEIVKFLSLIQNSPPDKETLSKLFMETIYVIFKRKTDDPHIDGDNFKIIISKSKEIGIKLDFDSKMNINNESFTLLQLAAKNGKWSLIVSLIENGVNPFPSTINFTTDYVTKCFLKDYEQAYKSIIDEDHDAIDKLATKLTSLQYRGLLQAALRNNKLNAFSFLLKSNIKIEDRSSIHEDILFSALKEKNSKIAGLLISNNAPILQVFLHPNFHKEIQFTKDQDKITNTELEKISDILLKGKEKISAINDLTTLSDTALDFMLETAKFLGQDELCTTIKLYRSLKDTENFDEFSIQWRAALKSGFDKNIMIRLVDAILLEQKNKNNNTFAEQILEQMCLNKIFENENSVKFFNYAFDFGMKEVLLHYVNDSGLRNLTTTNRLNNYIDKIIIHDAVPEAKILIDHGIAIQEFLKKLGYYNEYHRQMLVYILLRSENLQSITKEKISSIESSTLNYHSDQLQKAFFQLLDSTTDTNEQITLLNATLNKKNALGKVMFSNTLKNRDFKKAIKERIRNQEKFKSHTYLLDEALNSKWRLGFLKVMEKLEALKKMKEYNNENSAISKHYTLLEETAYEVYLKLKKNPVDFPEQFTLLKRYVNAKDFVTLRNIIFNEPDQKESLSKLTLFAPDITPNDKKIEEIITILNKHIAYKPSDPTEQKIHESIKQHLKDLDPATAIDLALGCIEYERNISGKEYPQLEKHLSEVIRESMSYLKKVNHKFSVKQGTDDEILKELSTLYQQSITGFKKNI